MTSVDSVPAACVALVVAGFTYAVVAGMWSLPLMLMDPRPDGLVRARHLLAPFGAWVVCALAIPGTGTTHALGMFDEPLCVALYVGGLCAAVSILGRRKLLSPIECSRVCLHGGWIIALLVRIV